jgi:hypothetical protein
VSRDTPDLQALKALNARLAQATAAAHRAALPVAHRAALEANAFFAARKVPIQVDVASRPSGPVLRLRATKKLTKSFSGRSPEQVVREILTRHLTEAKESIGVEVARNLQ